MKASWKWNLRHLFKKIGVHSALYSLLGVMTALIGLLLKDYVPESLSGAVGADSVDKILGILSSSMLAVTTFSLSTMVGAYGSASSGATPRATQLLIQDTTTQNVLSSFIGSFLFSVVGIIALQMGVYGERGKVVLFIATLAVLLFVIYNLLRWINHLTQFGRLGETTSRVEKVTEDALKRTAELPYLGARPRHEAPLLPAHASAILGEQSGYVQFIDLAGLANILKSPGKSIYCEVVPGSFVGPNSVLAYGIGLDDAERERVKNAFSIAIQRSFEQDPRFGLCALSEIASRALSPAVNDPGTGIDVISRGTRLLINFAREKRRAELEHRQQAVVEDRSFYPVDPRFNNLYCAEPTAADFFDDFFIPIGRDGAGLIEVMITLLKALKRLAENDPELYGPLAKKHGEMIFKRAEKAMPLKEDLQRLEEKLASLKAL